MKKVTKFGLEVLTGKALSFWLETSEEVFCLQMQIELISKRSCGSFCKKIIKFSVKLIYEQVN